MAHHDKALTKLIGAFLRTADNTGFLNFAAGGGVYRTADYSLIGTLMVTGKIRVFVDANPKYKGMGQYDVDNVMTLSEHQSGQPEFIQALAIHEATHAIQDKAKLNLRIVDAEVGAYIAQATYLAKRGKSENDFSGDEKPIFVAALALAAKVLAGEKVGGLIGPLKAAILAHPAYKEGKTERYIGNG